MQNLQRKFDRYYIGQIYGGDFAKFCGLLRIYGLYQLQIGFKPYVKFHAKFAMLKFHKVTSQHFKKVSLKILHRYLN